jgi:hypothetical protein
MNEKIKQLKYETLDRLERRNRDTAKTIDALNELADLELSFDPTIDAGAYFLDFEQLTHAEVIEIIQKLPGAWDKNENGARIDYIRREPLNCGVKLRIWAGEPPPSCRIIEEEVEIPAVPARKELRKKLVCKEATELTDATIQQEQNTKDEVPF